MVDKSIAYHYTPLAQGEGSYTYVHINYEPIQNITNPFCCVVDGIPLALASSQC